jgi:hypothetical protein
LDTWSGGGWGVFIATTTNSTVGDAVCRWVRQPRRPTVRVLTVSTIGALTSWGTGRSGAVPDRSCSLSDAPSGAALSLRELSAHYSRCRRPLESTVALASRCFAGTPDSPVAHRTVR